MSGQRDAIANAPIMIDHAHANGHAGRTFFVSQTNLVANSGYLRTIMSVPSGSYAHANFKADSEALALLSVRAVGSYSHASSLRISNSNFMSPQSSSVGMFSGGSLEVTSATIMTHLLGSGKSGQAIGGNISSPFEFIWKGPYTVAFDIQNIGVVDKMLSCFVFWYEPNKG